MGNHHTLVAVQLSIRQKIDLTLSYPIAAHYR